MIQMMQQLKTLEHHVSTEKNKILVQLLFLPVPSSVSVEML